MARAAYLMLAVSVLGCSSFRTSAVDRTEADTLVVNPEKPLKGIPVSLPVPSHLELSVVEKTFWEKVDIGGEKPILKPLHTCRPTRSVTHEIKYTEKVFLVDPVRPGAGTEDYGFTFKSKSSDADERNKAAGKGYLQNVKYKIDDQTITESAKLIANSIGLIRAFQTSAVPNSTTSRLVETNRVVAFGRFDINSPTFEEEVAAFLECNVNCATGYSCPKVCEAKCQE